MKQYTIILVENDEDERFFMKEALDNVSLFHILAMVRNGNELFEWLSENDPKQPDLILTDLNMPGKNGYDILSEVGKSQTLSAIPVFITSTSTTPSITEKCMELGAADYLIKPDSLLEYPLFFSALHEAMAQRPQH